MDLVKMLIDGAAHLEITIDENKAHQLIKYKELLVEWNEKINLTAITEDTEVITKHFLDSLTPFKFVDFSGKSVIDVGTGAGFPGYPLKIVDNSINLTLLDSLNKRINFLEEVKNQLGLGNVNLVHGRAEDFGINKDFREKFDYAVPRAVANLSTLSEYCLPFVKVGGYFISLKGPDVEEELRDAKKAVEVLGGEIEKVERVQIPFTDITHSIIFIKKIKQTPSNYPRKAGKPSKEPIK